MPTRLTHIYAFISVSFLKLNKTGSKKQFSSAAFQCHRYQFRYFFASSAVCEKRFGKIPRNLQLQLVFINTKICSKILIILCLEKISNTTRKRNKTVVLFSQRKKVKLEFKKYSMPET